MPPLPVRTLHGRTRDCPRCRQPIRYYVLKNWVAPTPFFYCDTCNNILLRASDARRVPAGSTIDVKDDEQLLELWETIVASAPLCPCGGRFAVWANVKCPACRQEFPYNQGVLSAALRVNERDVIVIDGAAVLGDTDEQSWVARIEL